MAPEMAAYLKFTFILGIKQKLMEKAAQDRNSGASSSKKSMKGAKKGRLKAFRTVVDIKSETPEEQIISMGILMQIAR